MWNWEQDSWPHFIYEPAEYILPEQRFFEEAGLFHGMYQAINREDCTKT